MAVRLNVMIIRPSQHGGGSDPHHHYDEQCDHVVGTLLGRPGIDVILLDRIPNPNDDVTEIMAIESISGDLAVVAWQAIDPVLMGLNALGKTWTRTPHRRDSEAKPVMPPIPGAFRLYFFDMRRPGSADAILSDVQRLHDVRAQPMFSIGTPPAPKPTKTKTDSTNKPHQETPTTVTPSQPSQSAPSDLDDLVDELDRLNP